MPSRPVSPARRWSIAAAMLAAILLALGARAPAIAETGLDGHRGSPTAPRGSLAAGAIQLVSTSDQQGYHIEFYRNTAYPCAISGYQTFAISHRIGQSEAASAPLWVYMHGGGGGWFDSAGAPQPDAQYKTEESLATLLSSPAGNVLMPGLMPLVFADPAAFRVLAVSMCDHDFYGGSGAIDPNNPNRQPNGDAITTNGLLATEDAIQFIRAAFATSKYFLFGGSAGSIGTYGLAWSLQFKGIAPAGIVADSSILNQEWAQAMVAQDVPCPVIASMLGHVTEIQARLDPQIADIANEPDRLVSSGRLTVPIMQIWSHGDPYGCQAAPVACPLRDGSTAALGAMDCMNEPLRIVIAAQGPSSRSKSLGLCVTVAGYAPGLCNYHMVTRIAGTNTDPSSPADYNATVMAWIRQRLADAAPNAVGGIAEAPDVAQLGANVYASGSEPLVAIFATSAGVLVLAVGGLCYARRRR